MKIRKAVESDLEFISSTEVVCWNEQGASKEDFYNLLQENSSSVFLDVLETEGVLRGFVGYLYDPDGNYVDIWNLAIAPEYRRSGYGFALIKHLQSKALSLKVHEICLKVSEQNTSAIKLYEKLGFETVERIENYYSAAEAAFRLTLKLIH
ncbi:MAG: GNAT family N-acetyltransferase [Bdellovibrio sp.]